MSIPPNQPPTGGYPQPGDGGYNPSGGQPGSGGPSQSGWAAGSPDPTQQYGQPPYGGQPGGYQPTEQYPQTQGGYGEPAPQWGQQPAAYPSQGGYGGPGGPQKSSALPWVIGGLVLLLVAGGVGLFFLLKDDSPTPIAGTTTASTTTAEVSSEEETTEETSEETTTEEESTGSSPTPEEGPPPPAGGPAPIGSGDPNVDALAQSCFVGDMQACDDLYTATAGPDQQDPDPTPEFQPFFDYAFTCGDRLTEEEVAERFCVNIWPDA